MTRLWAIFFGIGLMKPAPGTWGSLVAVLLGWVIIRFLGFPALVLATVAITLIGFWAVGAELKDRPGDDPSEFVIDEVAGQWLALLFPAAEPWRGMTMLGTLDTSQLVEIGAPLRAAWTAFARGEGAPRRPIDLAGMGSIAIAR